MATTPQGMTLAQLRAFLSAARTGSFSAAADELGLSQASISELVRRLEEEYRLVLFIRGGRRLRLTAAGELLRPIAERVCDNVAHADNSLRAFGGLEGGVASFGVMRNAEHYLLSDLAQTFRERYPMVRVRLVGQNSVEVAASVAAGDLEAGVVVLPVDVTTLDVRHLFKDEVVVVTHDRSAYGDTVDIEQLVKRSLVLYDARYGTSDPTRRQLTERAAKLGLTLEPMIEVEQASSALRLVRAGLGDTIVSRGVTRSSQFPRDVHVVPFTEPLYDEVVSVTKDAGSLSPASRELLTLAEEMLMAYSGPAE